MLFRFYCDESYDGNPKEPNTLAISGFFSDQPTWDEVEKDWDVINHRYGVSRFHASALNGATKEYAGWPKEKRDHYSAELLMILNRQKRRMVAYNCGMRADKYRQIISEEGRLKLGSPWFACFKSCIAMIAKHMETLPAGDRFAVSVDSGSGFDRQAVGFFETLAHNPKFAYRHRLKDCTAARADRHAGLQVADLMAYEYFKRLKDKEGMGAMRKRLELIREYNHYEEGFFGENVLTAMKDRIESAQCGPGELVIIPDLQGDSAR